MHGGALVLNAVGTRQLFRPNVVLGLVTAFTTGIIFLFRGRNFRATIWGDDELLVAHAINRQAPFGRLHFIDPFGFLDPFAGYLVVILRVTTRVLIIGGTDDFPQRAVWIAAVAWTVAATIIALIIGRCTRPLLGFMAALTLAIMPFSNFVMLTQLNPICLPAVLALIVAVATRQYPKSRIIQTITCVVVAFLTLSSITTIIAFGYLLWLVYIRTKRVQNIERRLVWVIGGSLILQVMSYQPRRGLITPSKFLHELRLSLNAFAPQFVREKILEPKSVIENFILYGIPILLGVSVFLLVRLGRQSSRRAQVEIAQVFFLLGFLLLCLLIAGNGWLNSHYLFIPTGLFWIGVILVSDAARQSANRIRMVPIVIVLFVFLIQLSGTYFVI